LPCLLLAAGAYGGVAAAVVSAEKGSQPASEEGDCVRQAGEGRAGPALEPTVKLVPEPDSASQVVNFGGSRGWQFADVVLNARPALPKSLEPREIRLEVLRRFTRTSDSLPTASAPTPRFTEPRISPGRDRITFTVCLNGTGLSAGSYSGNVLVEGPQGLAPASVSVTANAKNATLAWLGGVGVVLLAALFLVLRGAAARQAKTAEENAKEFATAADAAGRKRAVAKQDQAPRGLMSYLKDVFKDLNWWVTSVVALGIAIGTIIGIYSATPAWGADTLGSVVSLVGPAFTAVGVQSVITSLGRPVGR
jgi:hypothetical protein